MIVAQVARLETRASAFANSTFRQSSALRAISTPVRINGFNWAAAEQ